MKNLTYDNIFSGGQIILENELYQHYHDSKMFLMYDRNCITFKKIPVMMKLIEAETYMRKHHFKYGQYHLRFTFPPNEELPVNLTMYLKDRGYTIGHSELYAIDPAEYLVFKQPAGISIEQVDLGNLDKYLSLQHWQDFAFGVPFAKQKQLDYRDRFESEQFIQLLALDEDIPVGSVDVILSDGIGEIDNLFVEEAYQRRGIGSALQTYVMNLFSDRTIVLVADGDDTVKDMYKKQTYHYLGFRYEALKA